MTALHAHIRTFTFSAMLAAMPLTAASAQSVEEAIERLRHLSAEHGLLIEWDSLDVNGSDATLSGARAGTEAGKLASVGDISIEGVSRDDKGYRIESISFSDYVSDIRNDDAEDAVMMISGASVSNVLLPDEALRADYGGFFFYENAAVESMVLTIAGQDIFTMSDLHISITEPDADKTMAFTSMVHSFNLDLSVIEDKDQLAMLQALGYEQIDGSMEMAGSWNLVEGRLDASQLDFTVNDAGTLGLSFDLGGYTPALIASLRDMQKQMTSNPEGDNSTQGLAMLGLLQQLTFHSAEIAFTDDSLTGKVLDYVAAKQGMKPADVANQAKAIAPFLLAQLNNSELTAQASQALTAFLDNPQSLRISAKPANPVPFALIMATAMSSPTELTRSLAVSIKAND